LTNWVSCSLWGKRKECPSKHAHTSKMEGWGWAIGIQEKNSIIVHLFCRVNLSRNTHGK
jgi:hypothetical protein